MRKFTQTTFGEEGNCWQTAVACLLEVDPAELPSQSAVIMESHADGLQHRRHYSGILGAYLFKHHRLTYVELYQPGLYQYLTIKEPGWHLLTGTTVRTGTAPGFERHVVVGRYGEMVWDPHPTRAGLVGDIHLALLIPFPVHVPQWLDTYTHGREPCICPACFLQEQVDALALESEKERGVRPVVIVCNPCQPGVNSLSGYTVKLDEGCEMGVFHFR